MAIDVVGFEFVVDVVVIVVVVVVAVVVVADVVVEAVVVNLDDKGEDGFPSFGIALELLLVVAVLAQGPEGHLISSSQAEKSG